MAKLVMRDNAFVADYFNKQGKRVRHQHKDKESAIRELESTGRAWTDESDLQPGPGEDSEKRIPFMTKLPGRLIYELRVCAAVRRSTIQGIVEKGLRHELAKGPRLPFDN